MMISLLRVLLLVRQGTGGVERGERRRERFLLFLFKP
jgi:hypothetical protein